MASKIEFPQNDSWYHHFVSYGETDTMGVLYYAEYLHLFERSRSLFIRERGMSYAEVENAASFCRFVKLVAAIVPRSDSTMKSIFTSESASGNGHP